MVKHRALGKGLGALIPAAQEPADRETDENRKGIVYNATTLPVSVLLPNPEQPRKEMDQEGLQALAESLKTHGIVQPLVVRERNGVHEIVAGERRWRAAQLAGITHVPVTHFSGTDQEAMEVSLIENIQREDLSPLEIADAIMDLTRNFSLTQEEVSKKLGWSRSAITNKLRLLKLPDEIKSLLRNGLLSEGHGRALLALETDEERNIFARKAIYKMWSVRQLEKTIQQKKTGSLYAPVETAVEKSPTPFHDQARSFAKRFGLSLKVSGLARNMKLSLSGLDGLQIEKILDIIEKEGEYIFPGK